MVGLPNLKFINRIWVSKRRGNVIQVTLREVFSAMAGVG
jgi:hypothetical protein